MHRNTNHSNINSQHPYFVFWRFQVQFSTHRPPILSSTSDFYQLYQTNTTHYVHTIVTQLDSMLVYQASSYGVVLHKQNGPLTSTKCKTFGDVTLCCWVRGFQHFKELWALHLQGDGIHFLESMTLENKGPQPFKMSGTTYPTQSHICEGVNHYQLNFKLPQKTHILWQTTKQYINVEQWEKDLSTI